MLGLSWGDSVGFDMCYGAPENCRTLLWSSSIPKPGPVGIVKMADKLMLDKIKEIKSISVIKNEKIYEIKNSGLLKSVKFNGNNSKYNLIIICTGNNSDLVKNTFSDQTIENSYKEISITTILKHNSFENNMIRQIFLKDEILALLPISNTKTSIVWTIKEHMKESA